MHSYKIYLTMFFNVQKHCQFILFHSCSHSTTPTKWSKYFLCTEYFAMYWRYGHGLWNLELQKEDISPVNTLMPPIPARRFVCLPSLPSLSSQCCLCQLYYYYFCKFYYCNLIIQLKFIWTDLNPMELHITSLSIYIN